jgi:hypothetical protein
MFRNTFRFLIVLSFVALTLTVAPACATTITTYTDLASWQAASSGVTLVDFEGCAPTNGFTTYNSTCLHTSSVQFIGYTANTPVTNLLEAVDTNWSTFYNFGTSDALLVRMNRPQTAVTLPYLHIVLPANTTAFGIDLFSVGPNGLSFTITIGATQFTVPTSGHPNPATFFGITSDTAIGALDLTLQGTVWNGDTMALFDNVRFGTAQLPTDPTPEAATFLLIGSGLIGLMVLRKRIMKNKPEPRPLQNNPVLGAC